jgi:hypothetical protein
MGRLASMLCVALAALAATAGSALAASPPAARTGNATAVTPQTATINGSINPRGVPTAFYFRFGTTKAYGTRTSTGDAGAGVKNVAASAPLTGLRPNTTYHYQLVAFSTAGTSLGADRTFKTRQIPTALTLSASPNPVVYGAAVSVAGALTGPDIAGKKVALEVNPFPFTGPFLQTGNSVLTTPQGGYSFVIGSPITLQLRVVNQSKPGVASPTIVLNVALVTTLRARHARGGRVRFSGRVTPPRAPNAVLIQRRTRKGGWATVGITLTRAKSPAYSVFSKRLRLRRSGAYRAVVKTAAGDYVDGTSRTVKVSRR